RFEAAGLSICRDRNLCVATSDRREGRAPGGFAQHLRNLSHPGRKSGAGAA
ncbi:glycosyl transferase, partial [Mycobacterium sp. ITM-2017-0098]